MCPPLDVGKQWGIMMGVLQPYVLQPWRACMKLIMGSVVACTIGDDTLRAEARAAMKAAKSSGRATPA